MRYLISLVLLLFFCLSAKRITAQDIQYLPTVFQNNLIQLYVPVSQNDTLWLYTDTGGMNFIYKSGIKKLGGSKRGKNLWKKLNLDSLFEQNNIPVFGKKTIQYWREHSAINDGMLGREWFSGGKWFLDYTNHQFGSIQFATDQSFENSNQRIPLYFRKDASGKSPGALPRIEVVIDNDTLSFLVDTGAQVNLSKNAQETFHSDPVIATSFIIESIYKKWHQKHPEWKVIDRADESYGANAPMIRVPNVRIGSKEAGPVYFTVRQDPNFLHLSNLFMDQPVQGALGGNCLSIFGQIIIDYNSEYLELPD